MTKYAVVKYDDNGRSIMNIVTTEEIAKAEKSRYKYSNEYSKSTQFFVEVVDGNGNEIYEGF